MMVSMVALKVASKVMSGEPLSAAKGLVKRVMSGKVNESNPNLIILALQQSSYRRVLRNVPGCQY